MKQLTYQDINLPTVKDISANAVKMSIANVVATLHQTHQRSAQRQRLARLSIRLLDDIGITEAQRFEEISKPFWKA